MLTYSMGYRVSRIVPYILAPVLLFLSCEKIEPDLDNPQDPDNPDYEPPIVSIISGPADGETVNTSSVIFEWDGNELSWYRYKLSDNEWTAYNTATSVEFDYIDEGQYTFLLQAWYTNGDTSLIVSRSFTVDAVQGPALMFYPRRQFASIGDTITFQILAEEVDSLAGAELSINYYYTAAKVISITQGSIFLGSGESIFHSEYDNTQGILSVITAQLGGQDSSISGTGVLATIKLRVVTQVGILQFTFDGSEILRDPGNVDIQINQTINGQVNVQ